MYLAASAMAVSMLLGGLPLANGEAEDSPSAGRYSVLCRWVDADESVVVGPKLTLREGQQGHVAVGSESADLIGITADEDGAKKPQIAVILEGTSIEVTPVGRQPGGTTVIVVVEQSKVIGTETRQTGPDTFVQLPRLDIRKQRVIEFVKFGEVLTIPLGEKGVDGTAPALELVVCAGNATNIPSNWTVPAAARGNPGHEASSQVLNEVLATGAATVRCEKVSRWKKLRGHGLDEDLGSLGDLCELAGKYYSYCPHRVGLADALNLLAPVMQDPDCLQYLEECLLGCDWGYSVELTDSPSLVASVKLLAGMPELWDLTITTEHYDYGLLHYLAKVNVLHDLELCGENRAVTMQDGCMRQQWRLYHNGPGRATLALEATAQVFVEEAESALPALKAAENLRQVLIVAEDEAGAERLAKTQEILEKALPNANISTFTFSPGAATADNRARQGSAFDFDWKVIR